MFQRRRVELVRETVKEVLLRDSCNREFQFLYARRSSQKFGGVDVKTRISAWDVIYFETLHIHVEVSKRGLRDDIGVLQAQSSQCRV